MFVNNVQNLAFAELQGTKTILKLDPGSHILQIIINKINNFFNILYTQSLYVQTILFGKKRISDW